MSQTSSSPGAQFARDLITFAKSSAQTTAEATLLVRIFKPQGVKHVTIEPGNIVRLTLEGDARRAVRLDPLFALAIFGGLAFGGCIRLNRRGKRLSKCLTYAKTGPCGRTLAGIVMNAQAGTWEVALPRSADRLDCRRANLAIGYGPSLFAPRQDFINAAQVLFTRHAPAHLALHVDAYGKLLEFIFSLADARHPQAQEQAEERS